MRLIQRSRHRHKKSHWPVGKLQYTNKNAGIRTAYREHIPTFFIALYLLFYSEAAATA